MIALIFSNNFHISFTFLVGFRLKTSFFLLCHFFIEIVSDFDCKLDSYEHKYESDQHPA